MDAKSTWYVWEEAVRSAKESDALRIGRCGWSSATHVKEGLDCGTGRPFLQCSLPC